MIVWRVSSYDTPCPPSPSRRASRWGRAGGDVVNSWSTHPHGPWAELYRAEGLSAPADVLGRVATRLWVARVDDVDVLEVTDDVAASYGLAPADLVADDWSPCQAAAVRMVADGHRALMVPSAALPGTRNVVLFGQRLAVPFDAEIVDADVDLRCAVAADRSPGVPAVLDQVHHRGAPPPSGPYRQLLPTPLP